jgi:predicted transposase YbfD/YdcC
VNYRSFDFDVNTDPDGFIVDLDSLFEYLSVLTDCRHARGKRYALVIVLVFIVLAKLAGEDRLAGIAEWIALRKEQLAEVLHLVKARAPHTSTYSRILGRVVQVEELEKVVRQYFANQPGAGRSVVIALDGKTLRGTIRAGQTQGLHLLAAYLPAEGWVLMQVSVGCKENEITAAPKVLKCLDLRGKIITGDAMLAQRDLSAQIVDAGGDYVWKVKENQPQLLKDIETLFQPEKTLKGFSQGTKDFRTDARWEKGHGRLEHRSLTASVELKGYLDWPGAEQVFKLERTSLCQANGHITHETVYGITSLTADKAGPCRLQELVRSHWGIENGLHYRRDETCREDWCHLRIGEAARVMATINNLVLGLLLTRGIKNVPKARRRLAARPYEALQFILRSPA